jgi:hypothetical protein
MINYKSYLMILADGILLFVPWLKEFNEYLEEFNQVGKALSLVGGLVLLYYTIKKIRVDLKVKDLQVRQEEEKLKILQDED